MSKYGKTVFIEGSCILGKILKTMYDTAIKTFNMLLNNDSTSAECNFCSHLIYFQFLKLKRYDVVSKCYLNFYGVVCSFDIHTFEIC